MLHFKRAYQYLLIPVLLFCSNAHAIDIESPLRNLIQTSNLGDTQYSITVKDLDYNQYLAQINSELLLMPASNMKLLTTAASIDILGTDFVFGTELRLIENENGNLPSLIIKGDGDPAFCDPILLREHNLGIEDILDMWIKAIVDSGQTHFQNLYLDDRIFDYQLTHPDWEKNDLLNHYGAEISGLNFYLNCIDVTPIPSRYLAQEPRVLIFPDAPFLTTSNRAKTGKHDRFWISRPPDRNELTFHGTVKNAFTKPVQITVHEPAIFFSRYLISELTKRNITVDQIVRPDIIDALPTGKVLHVIRTTLPLVLARTNQDSVNLYAESLFKRIGNKITGEPGSWNNGAAAMRYFLRNLVGPTASTAQISDGSGLSRSNRISSNMIVQLLSSMYEDPEKMDMYRESLAYAGKTNLNERQAAGTLRKRFRDLNKGHWVFGKTGYLTGVVTVSGYYIYPSPQNPEISRTIAFSFLFNNVKPPVQAYQIKNLQDKMISKIQNALLMEERVNSN
ncbi:D-alanyl-D-alanine carboxypeptidase precursor [Poriferisphaera corsica]|uniref:D-alanyl-D-alanine carboxypeptidase n=1 Tax=Poriferisphaera corsica TaxID=2528020 RepID=A0A517YP39_9BACT|nr:D-alanyl-D-alanine carboxypeptidase/D-alanyl-D-alanine-endopeptidase [Poriferisphaera corsica]QDU31991.1 D-alanyl-D-alanine carboxypeptidase precursor [Poriferisphaera corsica]